MKLKFDSRGNLMPYEKIELNFDEFQDLYIKDFSGLNETRKEIFEDYQTYLKDFEEQISEDFIQWIDGSYITTKVKPRDIDFVMLIEHETFDRHEQYFVTEYDLVYWRGLFTETKRNRAKKKFPKGFIEIKFGKFKAEGHE